MEVHNEGRGGGKGEGREMLMIFMTEEGKGV